MIPAGELHKRKEKKMEITIHNTTKIVNLNGIPARIWEGKTKSGIPVHCYVTRIATHENEDQTEFEKELTEQSPPSSEVEAIPLKMIL